MEDAVHYLRSILSHLRTFQQWHSQSEGPHPSLGGEALADEIDWLDCYIDRIEKDGNPNRG